MIPSSSESIVGVAIPHPTSTSLFELFACIRTTATVDLICSEESICSGGCCRLLCELADTRDLLGIREPILLVQVRMGLLPRDWDVASLRLCLHLGSCIENRSQFTG